jgi:hypothetical protein
MRIDVHAHYWTGDYLDLLVDLGKADAGAARGIGAGGGAELEARLRLMERAGVEIRRQPAPHRTGTPRNRQLLGEGEVISLAIPPVLGGDHSVHRPGQADPFSLVDLAQCGPYRADREEEACFDITAGKTCARLGKLASIVEGQSHEDNRPGRIVLV